MTVTKTRAYRLINFDFRSVLIGDKKITARYTSRRILGTTGFPSLEEKKKEKKKRQTSERMN